MPRVHHVKKARKDNAVCKKGESYYYWTFRISVGKGYRSKKMLSRTKPRQSQLTQSPFMSQALAIGESIEDFCIDSPEDDSWKEDAQEALDGWKSEIETLGEEAQGSFDNMPEGLQQGDTGQTLEARVTACEEWVSSLEGIDVESCETVEEFTDQLTTYEGE